jgi:hypothetical protein
MADISIVCHFLHFVQYSHKNEIQAFVLVSCIEVRLFRCIASTSEIESLNIVIK